MDGLFKGIKKAHGDLPMMVLDDLSEMFGLDQMDYMSMDGASPMMGGRPRDSNGHTLVD